jgi:hypothetical protein
MRYNIILTIKNPNHNKENYIKKIVREYLDELRDGESGN